MSRRVKNSPPSPASFLHVPDRVLPGRARSGRPHEQARTDHNDDEDELDLLPVIEASPVRQLAPPPTHSLRSPDKLQTPSASPHVRPARNATPKRYAEAEAQDEGLRKGARSATKRQTSQPRSASRRADPDGNHPSLPSRPRPHRRRVEDDEEEFRTLPSRPPDRRGLGRNADRPASYQPAPDSRSPVRCASPHSTNVSEHGPSRSVSPSKRPRRPSGGLTFKPPAPTALTGERDLRAAQRAQLQEQRLQALAKRRRREEMDGEERGWEDRAEEAWRWEEKDRRREERQQQEEERREAERQRQRPSRTRPRESSRERPPTARSEARRDLLDGSSPRKKPAKRIKPDPDAEQDPLGPNTPGNGHPGDRPPLVEPAAPIPAAAPPLRRYPTPPTASAFLTSLPLPSLARLAPHFHALGCTSPGELLVLCDPAQRPIRDEFLTEAASKVGGISALERIMLNREMDVGWKKWTGNEAAA